MDINEYTQTDSDIIHLNAQRSSSRGNAAECGLDRSRSPIGDSVSLRGWNPLMERFWSVDFSLKPLLASR